MINRVLYRTCCAVLTILIMALFTVNCYAVTWSSNELIEKAKELNGRKLTYKGEAITAILNRGEYSWVNLNDGFNAIGVWCKSSSLGEVKFIGDYKNIGDKLEVTGIFNRACSMHNGELDIHADKVAIIKRGHLVNRPISVERLQSASALFMVVLIIVIVFRRKL